MNPLIISAPFGNYLHAKNATSTIGTFTAKERKGRWSQVLKTVRYYPHLGAWVNKIGLRNPGINSVSAYNSMGKIISIHGFNDSEWDLLLNKMYVMAPVTAGIELNLSCPNVPGADDYPADLFQRAKAVEAYTSTPFIVKIPPLNYEAMVAGALDAGLTWFHCCNTIPIPAGGLSGKPLKPISLAVIRHLRQGLIPDWWWWRTENIEHPHINIIGGGGITTGQDIYDYKAAGADYFAVGSGSVAFWRLPTLARAAMAVRP